MNILRLLPVLLSFLLLAAHFSRADNGPLVVASLAFPLTLFVPRPWVVRVTQLVLVLAGIEWLRTTVLLISRRQAAGEPWSRLAVILVTVSLFSVASALVFRLRALRVRYLLEPPIDEDSAT